MAVSDGRLALKSDVHRLPRLLPLLRFEPPPEDPLPPDRDEDDGAEEVEGVELDDGVYDD